MLINKAKRAEQNLKNLPFLPLQAEQVEFLFSPLEFKAQIIELIRQAKKRIYVTALYWQKDEAGQEILNEIYRVKQDHPELDVKILVDWHRGQRNLLGAEKSATNADWYCEQRQTYQLPDEPNMFFVCPLIPAKSSVYYILKALSLMIPCFIAAQVLITCIYNNKINTVTTAIKKSIMLHWQILWLISSMIIYWISARYIH